FRYHDHFIKQRVAEKSEFLFRVVVVYEPVNAGYVYRQIDQFRDNQMYLFVGARMSERTGIGHDTGVYALAYAGVQQAFVAQTDDDLIDKYTGGRGGCV